MEVHNQAMNTGGEKTFLLPIAVAEGSPTHPAFPSGHAINVGGYITALKVFYGWDPLGYYVNKCSGYFASTIRKKGCTHVRWAARMKSCEVNLTVAISFIKGVARRLCISCCFTAHLI